MRLKRATVSWIICLVLSHSGLSLKASTSFMDKNPELKKFLFQEPKTNFRFGFGISPISVLENRVYFTGNIFQVHWIRKPFDIELFSASVGLTSARDDYAGSRNFSFRIVPKFQLLKFLSVGFLVGIEFVSFPDIKVRLNKASLFTPSEPFSSQGLIYGVTLSQVVYSADDYVLKVNQLIYKQTYSTKEAANGWRYIFEEAAIENDGERTIIKPSIVFMLEVSLLF